MMVVSPSAIEKNLSMLRFCDVAEEGYPNSCIFGFGLPVSVSLHFPVRAQCLARAIKDTKSK